MTETVLVIVGPGLGRLVHVTGAATAVRRAHAAAHVVALTSPDAAEFARTMPVFNEVMVDRRAPWWRWRDILDLQRALRAKAFQQIYDFGDVARSRFLFRLIHGWRASADHPTALAWIDPPDTRTADPGMHIVDRITRQLSAAGIVDVPRPDLGWVARTVKSYSAPFKMNEPYALIATDHGAGGGLSLAAIIATAKWCVERSLTPVLVGLEAQPTLADEAQLVVPKVRDITGKAPVGDLVFLAWGAYAAIGADCGVITLVATAGCKTVVLCGAAADPATDGPRGSNVAVLQRESIHAIAFSEIVQMLDTLTAPSRRVP